MTQLSTLPALAEPLAVDASRCRRRWPEVVSILLIAALASFVMLVNLGAVYLWQDEAATAVLGERMMKFGKPVAYDGKNLITMDHYLEEQLEDVDRASVSADAAIRYYASLHHFKPDTTWINHPWGQFVMAGLSLHFLGHGTWQARLPFALAGVLTCLLLYGLTRRRLESNLAAWVAVLLLLGNALWVMHSRQCRYYSPSCLFLLLTVWSFLRWQGQEKGGAVLFVLSGWLWFQMDYGTFWPVVGVLLVAAAWLQRRQLWQVILVGAVLGATVAPWVWYYELASRQQQSIQPWSEKFYGTLLRMNQFIIPLVLLAAAPVVAWLTRRRCPVQARRLAMICTAIVPAMLLWAPTAAPCVFHRYIVAITPLGCLLMAWLVLEWDRALVLCGEGRVVRGVAIVVPVAVLIVTPWAAGASAWLLPEAAGAAPWNLAVLRPELRLLETELSGRQLDPNRAAVEWLQKQAWPDEEVVANYEDIPLMFYTPHPIRGGIGAFRISDLSGRAPRFLILRQSVYFFHHSIFMREINHYQWTVKPIPGPDIPWSNVPEPVLRSPEDAKVSTIVGAVRKG